MNKLTLGGIIFTILMLLLTWLSIGTTKGGLNGDIVNMLAVAGAIVLVIITVFVVIKYVRQMQVDQATGELSDERWDDIGEYKNPVPMGWAIMFLGTMIWGMWYFIMGYPVNAYSQIGEYNEDVKKHNEKFEKKYAQIQGVELTKMGESVFIAECKVCHGADGKGLPDVKGNLKAANLTHRIDAVNVKHVIMNGANNFTTAYPAGMPAGLNYMFANEQEIDKLSQYVANGFPAGDKEGAALFEKGTCSGCHGQAGEGIPGVGPNIAKFEPDFVVTVLSNGKKGAIGTMPAFERLNKKQKEAVADYISKGLPDTDDLEGE